jgi:excisionase family DNA binding protein
MSATAELARRYLSLQDAEAYCGLSERTLRRLAAQGKFRILRPSPLRRVIDREELDRYLDSTAEKRS